MVYAVQPLTTRFLQKDPLPMINRYAYVGGNPVNLVDPSGLCPSWLCPPNSGGKIRQGDQQHPLETVSDWTEARLDGGKAGVVDPVVLALQNAGYVDLSGTACVPILGGCGTAGVMLSFADGAHGYAGGGVGYGWGASISWAPGQHISRGLNCAGQGGFGFAAGQLGQRGIIIKPEGAFRSTPFAEVGLGLGLAWAAVCTNVR